MIIWMCRIKGRRSEKESQNLGLEDHMNPCATLRDRRQMEEKHLERKMSSEDQHIISEKPV